jgi:hypothetical protein
MGNWNYSNPSYVMFHSRYTSLIDIPEQRKHWRMRFDWKNKQEQQKKMLKEIKRELYKLDYDIETAARESSNILNLARNIL